MNRTELKPNTVSYTFTERDNEGEPTFLAHWLAEKINDAGEAEIKATSQGATLRVSGIDVSYGGTRPLTQNWLGATITACLE